MTKDYNLIVPKYDASKLKTGILHLGYGAFHRAHQSYYFDRLVDECGVYTCGIAVVNLRQADTAVFDTDTQNLPYVLRSVSPKGSIEDRLIKIHTQAANWATKPQEAEAMVASPDLFMITITVSEAGYYLNGDGALDESLPEIRAEKEKGEKHSVFCFLRHGLNARRAANGQPITIACCDNIRHNGGMLETNFKAYLEYVGDTDLLDWVQTNASFPNSMVDRITPQPLRQEEPELVERLGHALGPTIIAEDFIQWVVEDKFAAFCPPLDKVGATLTDSVLPYEETKIRVLNGGHTALTYMGALAGYRTFDQAFVASDLHEHFDRFEAEEVAKSLPKDLPFDAQDYIQIIANRFQNSYIGDTIERICSDGFAKFPIFIRPTLESCFSQGQTPVHAIRSVASWVVFSRRVFSDTMNFTYHEPNKGRLEPLVQDTSLEDFVSSETLWGDLATRFPQFKTELIRQVQEVEQKWPA